MRAPLTPVTVIAVAFIVAVVGLAVDIVAGFRGELVPLEILANNGGHCREALRLPRCLVRAHHAVICHLVTKKKKNYLLSPFHPFTHSLNFNDSAHQK